MFFRKLGHEKNSIVKFETITKTNEDDTSVRNECIKFVHSYRFLSSSSDSLFLTLVDDKHKTITILKKEIVGDDSVGETNHSRGDDILKLGNEIETLNSENRYDNDSIEDIKQHFPDDFKKLEKTLIICISEKDLRKMRIEFPDE